MLVSLCERTQRLWTLRLTSQAVLPYPHLSTFVQDIVPFHGALKGNDFRHMNLSLHWPVSSGSSGSQWAVKTVARVTVNLIWRHGADPAFTPENPEKHQPQLRNMNVSKPQLHFLQEKTLPPSCLPGCHQDRGTQSRGRRACCTPSLGRLNDRKAETTAWQLRSPDRAGPQLPSSPWQLHLLCPTPQPPPQTHPKGLLLALLPAAPGKPTGVRRMRRMQAWELGGEEVACPVGPHHLHWPHKSQRSPGSPQFKRLAVSVRHLPLAQLAA